IISLLKVKQGRGQPIRSDGPQRHIIVKQGTPTMGGLMILSGIFVSTLLWADLTNLYVWAVLFVTLGFGAIGFYDDFLKVTKSTTHGFSGKIRLLIEIVIAGIAVAIFMGIGDKSISSALAVPFFKDVLIQFGFVFLAVGIFIVVGAGNAVNITDGLDGLAIVPVMIAAGTYGLIAYLVGNAVFAEYLQLHNVEGTDDRHPILDHRLRPGADRPVDPQAQVGTGCFPPEHSHARRSASSVLPVPAAPAPKHSGSAGRKSSPGMTRRPRSKRRGKKVCRLAILPASRLPRSIASSSAPTFRSPIPSRIGRSKGRKRPASRSLATQKSSSVK